MDLQWTYGVALRREEEDGRVHAYASAMPDAIASGADDTEAMHEMGHALVAAVRGRIKFGLELTPPPPWSYGDPTQPNAIGLPAELAAKASVYILWRASGLSKVALAERLDVNEKEARRVLDPDHATGPRSPRGSRPGVRAPPGGGGRGGLRRAGERARRSPTCCAGPERVTDRIERRGSPFGSRRVPAARQPARQRRRVGSRPRRL